ncbi:hypothetical protein EYC84_010627 [Monilinia fructicola]|uniref:Cytochrome P450 n=1 Tax=Monilinia fructicola TaxID=38448 RepID=A0A5M9JB18_MONFR|nr:hypothetical protein EYC84_010627 [Monilinia fructicola]
MMKKYGRKEPIRIGPEMIFFPNPTSLKEIYMDRSLNTKSEFYDSGAFGPPHLFTTLSAEEHTPLRKALATTPWSLGEIRKNWEPRLDEEVLMFTKVMTEKAKAGESVILCDKLAEFAADIMTIVSFGKPWGFVENGRDERNLLGSWRQGLDFMGFTARFTLFRKHIIKIPWVAAILQPKASDSKGIGYLIKQAEHQLRTREYELSQGVYPEQVDFLQHSLEARINGEPLTPIQKRSHITLLIQAGADTTGTALGATLRSLAIVPGALEKAFNEIRKADEANLLSTPIKDEETRTHLPYMVGAVKEALRLYPSAPNWFPRVVPPEGKIIDGVFVPGNMDVTSNAMIIQRDPDFFGPDPDTFRPERWMDEAKAIELEHGMFVWGFGYRGCIGKNIAYMELFKLVPEIIRRFDIEVLNEGEYVCVGGISYWRDFLVNLHPREL